jgi:hypothetical protein
MVLLLLLWPVHVLALAAFFFRKERAAGITVVLRHSSAPFGTRGPDYLADIFIRRGRIRFMLIIITDVTILGILANVNEFKS